MGDPMPTVLARGHAGIFFDQKFAEPPERWLTLQRLRGTLATSDAFVDALLAPASFDATVAPIEGVATSLKNWFKKDADKWNFFIASATSGKFSDVTNDKAYANLDHAAAIVRTGIVRALEVSLNLAIGEIPAMVGTTPTLNSRGPLLLHWVCGKGDGFEVQVSWSAGQVDCYVITPPVRLAASSLSASSKTWQGPLTPAAPATGDVAVAMQTHPTGMLLIASTDSIKNAAPNEMKAILMHAHDGGVTA